MNTPFVRTEDDLELQFGVNHVGHYLFAREVMPLLRAAAPSRVIFLTSSAHLSGDILWDDPNWSRTPYDKFRAYAASKTANMLCAVGLDRRYSASGVSAFGVNPGPVVTNLHRHMTGEDIAAVKERIAGGGGIVVKSVAQGAASVVWAATARALDLLGGLYIEDCGVAAAHEGGLAGVKAHALDPLAADRLLSLSDEIVRDLGY